MRRLTKAKAQREPTIALINIVFLMLVFFMVAGTLSQPLDTSLRLVQTRDLEGRAPPDTLVIHADGRLTLRGQTLSSPATYVAGLAAQDREVIRIVPDRALPALDLVEISRQMRLAGAQKIMIVTERALK